MPIPNIRPSFEMAVFGVPEQGTVMSKNWIKEYYLIGNQVDNL